MKSLKSQVALVTGGSSGIGRAIAMHFADFGARVAVLGRSEDQVAQVAGEVEQNGGQAMGLAADISDEVAMKKAIERLVERWGGITTVVANAGINGVWASVEELKVDEWRKTLDVNLTGTFITVKVSLPHMRAGGSIIVVSSINGNRVFTNTGATAYATSKAGQVAMTKMLALELADARIRVNSICPGWIETPIHNKTVQRHTDSIGEPVEFPEGSVPLTDGKPGTPEQVAAVALFLASDQASHVTGANIYVDGGQSLLEG